MMTTHFTLRDNFLTSAVPSGESELHDPHELSTTAHHNAAPLHY